MEIEKKLSYLQTECPDQKTDNVAGEDNDIPEPHGREYLLVEQIDREYTFHCVAVGFQRVAYLAYTKIAQSHSYGNN